MTKARKVELVLLSMERQAERGRDIVLQDTLYIGATRALIKDGRLRSFKRCGQWCVTLS